MRNINAWQLVLISTAIFIIGQLLAFYFYWLGTGTLGHDSVLMGMALMAAVTSFGVNIILWAIKYG